MDGTDVRGYPAVIALTHSPAGVRAGQWKDDSHEHVTPHPAHWTGGPRCRSDRRRRLAVPSAEPGDVTVAEERFARMIAAAHAPDVTCARQAERYADAHWLEYVVAARAVLGARA